MEAVPEFAVSAVVTDKGVHPATSPQRPTRWITTTRCPPASRVPVHAAGPVLPDPYRQAVRGRRRPARQTLPGRRGRHRRPLRPLARRPGRTRRARCRPRPQTLRHSRTSPPVGQRVQPERRQLVNRDFIHAESWAGGSPGCRLTALTIDELRPALLAAGLTERQLERAQNLLTDPRLVLAGHLLHSTAGRKPMKTDLEGEVR